MIDDLLPPPAAPGAVAIPMNDAAGDAPIDRVLPPEEGTPGDIAAASRALRNATANPTDQPRNPDGTFASPAADAPAEPAPDAPVEGEPAAEEEPAPADEAPKLLVLKGEAQRGETDIEIDLSGLPPEAIQRIELLERNGLRRKEFDTQMQSVKALRADLDAVETEMAVDPTGFMLERMPPARRLAVAEALLLDQWNALAPMIEQLWTDDASRFQKLSEVKSDVSARRNDVVSAVAANRHAAQVRDAVTALIPENVPDADAQEFYLTGIGLLQAKANAGESVAPAAVSALLAAHRRRYFGAGETAPSTPPTRPKLAVRPPPSAAPSGTAPSQPARTVLRQDQIAAAAKARQSLAAIAGRGAGTGAVQRPGPGPGATIEETSRFIRQQAGRSA